MHLYKRKVSALALIASLIATNACAQTTLPTINVGNTKPKKIDVRQVQTPQKPLPLRNLAAQPASEMVAQADPNDGYQSSALQSTILGPRINYPRVPTNLDSSSERVFTGGQVNVLPAFRPGEALEIVPGLAVMQHSGEGKANQYYLRGFDLDHGTDLALYLDSMPLNMRTHGHGQGYADANFIMPELLETVDARKGPYNVEDGDFSNAGTIRMQYLHRIPEGVFTSTGGAFGYGRQFGMKSWSFANGDILGAGEISTYNGPWTTPNNARKINGVLRYTQGEENNGLSIMGMAYANRWNSTDQVPLDLISSGQMSRWGTLNPKDGGETTRFSVSGHWAQETSNYKTRVEAFAMHSTLGLNNDFAYFLQYPDSFIGDQFRQFDRRTMIGTNAYHTLKFDLLNKESELRVGFQSRYDNIRLGLGNEVSRQMFNIIRNDLVGEANTSLLTDFKTKWAPWLKTTVGARWDYYWGSNNGLQTYANSPVVGSPFAPDYGPNPDAGQPYHIWTAPFNNGSSVSQLISPKGSVVINPWDDKTDFYLNFGRGFHSNDFRATTQTYSTSEMDDNYGYVPVKRQLLLSPSTGAEVGVKTKKIEGLESAATVFFMRTQTENIFEGNTGNTKITRGADRIGVEFTNHYRPISWAAFEADVTATHARFRGYDWEQGLLYYGELLQPDAIPYGTFKGNGPGNYLINATPVVATGSIELGEAKGWFGAAKYRYIAPRALTQDGFFKSPAIGTVNLRAGYRWEEGWKLQLDVFNMMNSRSMQIAYAYGSLVGTNTLYSACAPTQTAPSAVCGTGKMGVVGHPIEPPSWRLTFGGPLNFDANPNKRPDLLEPFSMLAKREGETSKQLANWTGPYLGLNLGGGSNTASNSNNLWFQDAVYGGITKNINPNTTGGGLIAGGQAGYTYQLTPLFVTGVEADLQGTTMTGGVNGGTYSALLNLNDQTGASYVPGYVNTGSSTLWYGTVRGRSGIAIQPDLWIYGTGGFAYANVQQAAGYQTINFQTGWTVGGGVEWMFKSNWSAKAEYLYADVQGGPATIGNNYGQQLNNSTNSSRWSTIRAGANYHLNFDQAEPVIAKY